MLKSLQISKSLFNKEPYIEDEARVGRQEATRIEISRRN
jgi:hypothetical protein